MIYMVEIRFSSPEHEDEWNAWYSAHLHTLLSVTGIETAQRLEAITPAERRYIAIYTIASEAVFTSAAYAGIGGGGIASAKWKAWISRRRTLFSGVDTVPEITDAHCLILADDPPEPVDLPGVLFAPLYAVALDKSPARRSMAVARREDAQAAMTRPGMVVYQARGPRQVAGPR